MANKRVIDLPVATSVTSGDYLHLVQDGIDKKILASAVGGGSGAGDSSANHVELTQSEFDALETVDSNTIYFITNEDGGKIYKNGTYFGSSSNHDDTKTEKHLLGFDGTKITDNGSELTYDDVYAMLMESPDFVVLVYEDRAYHPNVVKESQIVFISSFVSEGYERMDRISMLPSGDVTVTYGESENVANKTNGITDLNKDSDSKYPTVKAVVDYIESEKSEFGGDTHSVDLTKAEFDALEVKDDNTTYYITDMDVVNTPLPFRFGIDENGNYGYYKTGADELTTFSSGGGGGISYSTEEQDTGLKWIDGKEIYQITVIVSSFSGVIWSNPNMTQLISLHSYAGNQYSGTFFGSKLVDGGTTHINISHEPSVKRLYAAGDWSSMSGFITVQYTK